MQQYPLFDNHFHLRQTLKFQPMVFDSLSASWGGRTSCHDNLDYETFLEHKNNLPGLVASFGIHPQWPVRDFESYLEKLAYSGGIESIGECGFDFFEGRSLELEKLQDELFKLQIDLALQTGLPMIIHLRRATDKVFQYSRELKKVSKVIFHSWPGPLNEAESILKAGINAFFSFGTTLLWGAKKALNCARSLPPERIVFETDAPYQAIRGQEATMLTDLFLVQEKHRAILL